MNPNPPDTDPEAHDAHLAQRTAGLPGGRKDRTMLIGLILLSVARPAGAPQTL